jgi:hypothetical protein
MNHLKKILRITPAVTLLVFLVSVPAFAQRGSDDQAVVSSTSGSEHTGSTTTVAETHKSNEAVTTESDTENSADDSMRSKGEREVKELRKQHGEHKTEDRQKFCNLHKDNLSGKFNGLTTSATSIQTHIDSVYVKVQAFVADKNLTVDNYAALVASVNTAKAKAATDIAALTPPTLDCASPTVATDVATYKQTATQTRTDLKAYRDAVKELFKAVKAAAAKVAPTASDTSTTTSTSATTTEGAN